ncbi:MAG: serine/threonine-protein phosphatase [Phycisphaeraceae bacterium]|nr:serine/threonine-protein phosphatase [Phycisphaeraceae bacterium]
MMTATVTAEFRDEFEAERTRLLRRRILWYLAVYVLFGVFIQIVNAIGQAISGGDPQPGMNEYRRVMTNLSWIIYLIYIGVFLFVRQRRLDRGRLLRLIFWVIVIATGIGLIISPVILSRVLVQIRTENGNALNAAGISGAMLAAGLWGIFIAHFFASLFIPWTFKESLNPFIVLYSIFVGSSVVLVDLAWWGYLVLALGVVIGAPGATICWWRHSRFRDQFHYSKLRGRYGQMKQELTDARRIHESLFPAPIKTGAARMDFRYQPMGQIGGDYLFAFRFPGLPGDDPDAEPLSVVLLDVTGHGIAAALTVNRLHGELERLFAEEPDIAPGDVLVALNRYIHLTLATHSVYATAVCLRLDSGSDSLQWASAGHPPVFLRSVDGRLEQLDSTTFVLGACAPDDFIADEQRSRMGVGDTIIAYTDGAIEAMNDKGRMLGVNGLRSIVLASRPDTDAEGGWSSAILRAIDSHRHGPALDDTLIVEIFRPLRVSSAGAAGRL